jgi:hypothetical protein
MIGIFIGLFFYTNKVKRRILSKTKGWIDSSYQLIGFLGVVPNAVKNWTQTGQKPISLWRNLGVPSPKT